MSKGFIMLSTIFQYTFLQRALVVGIFLSIAAALVGVPLILRKKSILSDGLSHLAFGAVAVAMFVQLSPTIISMIIAAIAALLILKKSKNGDKNTETQIAILSISALAIGMIFLSINRGTTIDPNSYLFGSILTLTQSDVVISLIISIVTTILFIVFYKQIFATSFDPEFADAVGIKTSFYDAILAIICSLIVVIGMKLCGSLLIGALIIFPCMSAMQIAKSFKGVIISASLLAILAFMAGFVASCLLSIPTGASIAVSELIIYLISRLVAKI